jgi:CRISPR-associated endonuclease/helicase Cas3
LANGRIPVEDLEDKLADCLKLEGKEALFPWQRRLLKRFIAGDLPETIDLPTGLGKTSVMAIWLVARAGGGDVPRRLVYVVDRRTVVDQATKLAEQLQKVVEGDRELADGLDLEGRSLPISTLRGQFADNREWLHDPSLPAIVVGTVDMVGSRLLFSGYGVRRKMRPYHAALLGADALHLVDESHLVPPYLELLREIVRDQNLWGRDGKRLPVLPFKVIDMSATALDEAQDDEAQAERRFGLEKEDYEDPQLKRRLEAPKELVLKDVDSVVDKAKSKADDALATALAQEVWNRYAFDREAGSKAYRYLVYAHERRVAQKVAELLRKRPEAKAKKIDVEVIVGQRRVYERTRLFERLTELGFIGGTGADDHKPAFLVATSAGEVGIDIDADRIVCDLVPWERMVQRFGRCNRRGDLEGGAVITVLYSKDSDQKQKQQLKALRALEGEGDASPAALVRLAERARCDRELAEVIRAASSKPSLRPPFSTALGEDLAMTSLDNHPGRPKYVWPWLRGWDAEQEPETTLVWRAVLPDPAAIGLKEKAAALSYLRQFFKAAPPHLKEHLTLPADEAASLIIKRAEEIFKQQSSSKAEESEPTESRTVGTVLTPKQLLAVVLDDRRRPVELLDMDKVLDISESAGQTEGSREKTLNQKRKKLRERITNKFVVLHAALGGLDADGVASSKASGPVKCLDGSLGESERPAQLPFKVVTGLEPTPSHQNQKYLETLRLPAAGSEEEPTAYVVVFADPAGDPDEEDLSLSREYISLEDHTAEVVDQAKRLARRLGLAEEERAALIAAACHHDLGKKVDRWQRAASAPPKGGPYAKTKVPPNPQLLGGYRHELGSLILLSRPTEPRGGSEQIPELALHLIASHHGNGRPFITSEGCDLLPPSYLQEVVERAAKRFARLQDEYGPWFLAWLEATLRAADQEASRHPRSR